MERISHIYECASAFLIILWILKIPVPFFGHVPFIFTLALNSLTWNTYYLDYLFDKNEASGFTNGILGDYYIVSSGIFILSCLKASKSLNLEAPKLK